jgi:hypothetical protein
LTQCKADDFKKYKRLKSAWIKKNLSRVLEENPGTEQTATAWLLGGNKSWYELRKILVPYNGAKIQDSSVPGC